MIVPYGSTMFYRTNYYRTKVYLIIFFHISPCVPYNESLKKRKFIIFTYYRMRTVIETHKKDKIFVNKLSHFV
jgi:hypothetical protein